MSFIAPGGGPPGSFAAIGVDEMIDYTKGNVEERVKNVDVLIDTVGGDTTDRALETVKKGGKFIMDRFTEHKLLHLIDARP